MEGVNTPSFQDAFYAALLRQRVASSADTAKPCVRSALTLRSGQHGLMCVSFSQEKLQRRYASERMLRNDELRPCNALVCLQPDLVHIKISPAKSLGSYSFTTAGLASEFPKVQIASLRVATMGIISFKPKMLNTLEVLGFSPKKTKLMFRLLNVCRCERKTPKPVDDI